MTITAVKSAEGPTSGNRMIVLQGQGFHTSTIVKLGGPSGQACNSVDRITKNLLTCYTPMGSPGTVSIYVANSDGSSFTKTEAYTYCNAGSCTNICGNPGLWDGPFADGTGSSVDPYIICNDDHLNNARVPAHAKYLKLGDNIDLSDYTLNDFLPLTTNANGYFYAHLDGDGHVIANYTYNAPPGTNSVGLISNLYPGYDIKNVGMVNADVSGNHYVGALIGYCSSAVTALENVFATGKVTGTGSYVGGIMGVGYCNIINGYADAEVTGMTLTGGISGRQLYTAVNLSFNGTVTSNATSGHCYVGSIAGEYVSNGAELDGLSARGTVTCTNSNMAYVGGLFGRFENGRILNASFSGTVQGGYYTGGLVGVMSTNSKLETSTSDATVIPGSSTAGGLVGYVGNAEIIDCEYSRNITTAASTVGGIVGHVTGSASVLDNIRYSGTITSTSDNIGGLVGYMHNGVMRNSHSSGTVRGRHQVGGLVGYNYHEHLIIESSHSTADIIGTGDYVGGLVGRVLYYTTTTNSYATGNITGVNYVGGAFGQCRTHPNGPIQGTYATGDVTGGSYVGGFCGIMYNGYNTPADLDITESYATGDVEGAGIYVGGFVGYMDSNTKITKSHATGDVKGTQHIGGFVGRAYYDNIHIEQSYATGDVEGDYYIGGFLGYFYDGRNSRISDSYATGKTLGETNIGSFAGITADMLERIYGTGEVKHKIQGVGSAGGLVGGYQAQPLYNGLGGIIGGYWDKDKTKKSTSFGGGQGMTSLEMRTQGTFEGWDFDTVWTMPTSGPPVLKWQ